MGGGKRKKILRDIKMRKADSDPAKWTMEDLPAQDLPAQDLPPQELPAQRNPSNLVTCRHEVDHNLEDEFHRQSIPRVRRPPRLTLRIPPPPHLRLPQLQRHRASLSPVPEYKTLLSKSPSPLQDEIYWSSSPSPVPMDVSSAEGRTNQEFTDDVLVIDETSSRRSSQGGEDVSNAKPASVSPEPASVSPEPSKLGGKEACQCLTIKVEDGDPGQMSPTRIGDHRHVKCIALETLLGDKKRPASPTLADLPEVIQKNGATSWEIIQILKASHHFDWDCFQRKVLKAHQDSGSSSPIAHLLQLAADPPTSPPHESPQQLREKVQILESEKKEMADRIANLHAEVLKVTDSIRSRPKADVQLAHTTASTLTTSSPSLLRQSLRGVSVIKKTSASEKPQYTNPPHSSAFAQVLHIKPQGKTSPKYVFNFQGAVAGEKTMDSRGFSFVRPIGLADRRKQLEQVVQNHQEALLRAKAELDGRIPADIDSKVTQLFPLPFDLDPRPYQVTSSNIKLYHVSQAEVRGIEYRLALTYRIGVLLFDCLRTDPRFVPLAKMNDRCYVEQEQLLSSMLTDYMPARTLPLLTNFLKDKFGAVHPLAQSAVSLQIFSQISKFSYPIDQPNSKDFGDDLLKVPHTTMLGPQGWFPPLPALPCQGALFRSMTTAHSSGRAPLDPFKYIAWVSAHNLAFGRALAGPLFDSGTMSQVLPFIFQPAIFTLHKGGPAEIFPAILRVLRLHCFNLAARIVDCTMARTYVSNANISRAVFLGTDPERQTLFSDLVHDPFNIQFTGWPIPTWMETFGPDTTTHFAQKLVYLMQHSLFHISRPGSFSVDAWVTLKPSDSFNAAYVFVMQRERWIQSHLLSHEHLNFASSPFAQFVPTKTVYWMHYDH